MRLLAIDGLLKTAMEKGILGIKLVDRPPLRGSDAKDDTDECLVVVHVVLMGVTTNDPASLMAGKRPVSVVLMLVDTLVGDDIGTRSGNKAPTLVKSIKIWRGPW